jgi:hypothetical protein
MTFSLVFCSERQNERLTRRVSEMGRDIRGDVNVDFVLAPLPLALPSRAKVVTEAWMNDLWPSGKFRPPDRHFLTTLLRTRHAMKQKLSRARPNLAVDPTGVACFTCENIRIRKSNCTRRSDSEFGSTRAPAKDSTGTSERTPIRDRAESISELRGAGATGAAISRQTVNAIPRTMPFKYQKRQQQK